MTRPLYDKPREYFAKLIQEYSCKPIRRMALEMNIPKSTIEDHLAYAKRELGMFVPDKVKSATPQNHGRIDREIVNGMVIAGSDAHYWPGPPSTAHRAFVKLIRKFRPQLHAVVLNGDAMDLPRVSRHPPQGWTRMPESHEELEVVEERLQEIEGAAGRNPELLWPAGNHDIRFEMYLAANAPEVANIKGTRLRDHFPKWKPCWGVMFNNHHGGLFIKHRFKGGMHAPHNNALWTGRSMATGHLHSQKVQPITDMNGTRWGIDMGCLANPWGPQFEYLEGNPRQWRSGFAVFTFQDGNLLPPELVTVMDEEEGAVSFRGEILKV